LREQTIMVEKEMDAVLAARIARVMYTADLSDLAPVDIDTFLDTLEVEPFSDEQVARILGRIGLNGPAGPAPVRPHSAEPPRRLSNRRLPASRNVGYRLSCEELENRLPPSACGNALGASALEFGIPVKAVPAGATVRLWDAGQVMEVHGSPEAWEDSSAWEHGADIPSDVAWEALFGDMDYAVAGELQLAG
jgi:hypothetical protein